jgi:cytochrome c oxidase subunit II
MQMIKRLFLATMVALTPVAAMAAAPATAPAITAPPVTDTAAPTAAAVTAPEAAPAVAAPAFDHARPVDGIGQPIPAGIDFQPQVTENGRYAKWMNDALLIPMMAVVSLFVLGLMLWISVRYRAAANAVPSKTTHNTMIEVIWTLVPVLILVAIAVPSIDLLAKQYAPPPRDALTIKVTGYQWYWGYEYPDQEIPELTSRMLDEQTAAARGEPFQLAVDERMVVPVNRTVKLIVTGSDVIHSWAVPALWTKMDAVPGRLNEVTFRADRIGVYYGQCSELCGIDHGFMPIAVEVVSEADFARWVASKGGTMTTASAGPTPNAPTAGANSNAAVPSVAVEVPGETPAVPQPSDPAAQGAPAPAAQTN